MFVELFKVQLWLRWFRRQILSTLLPHWSDIKFKTNVILNVSTPEISFRALHQSHKLGLEVGVGCPGGCHHEFSIILVSLMVPVFPFQIALNSRYQLDKIFMSFSTLCLYQLRTAILTIEFEKFDGILSLHWTLVINFEKTGEWGWLMGFVAF